MRTFPLAIVLICLLFHSAAAGPTTRRAFKEGSQPESISILTQLNRQLPEVTFDAVKLADIMDFLGDVSGCDVLVDWKLLEANGVKRDTPITLKLRNVKFGKALPRILEAAGGKEPLAFQPLGGVIYISTKEGFAVAIDNSKPLDMSRWDAGIRENIEKKMPGVALDAVALSDVVQHLNSELKIKLAVDWDGFKKQGVDQKTPITMKLHDVEPTQAIRLIFGSVTHLPVELSTKDGALVVAPGKEEKPK